MKQWVGEHNTYAASFMDKLSQRDPHPRLEAEHESRAYKYGRFEVRNGLLLALHFDPGQAGPKLVVKAGDASIEGDDADQGCLLVTAEKVYFTVINGGPEEIRSAPSTEPGSPTSLCRKSVQ